MLSADMLLDEEALFKILRYGHSRIPVYEPGKCVWQPHMTCLCRERACLLSLLTCCVST